MVIALLTIPAAVISFRLWNGDQPPPSDDPGQIVQPTPSESPPDEQRPVATENPPPDDNVEEPADPPEDGSGEDGSFVPPDDPDDTDEPDDTDDTEDLPEIGPIGINLTTGTMQFMFAPELQDALDTDTVSMMGEFITSPRNTSNSKILVEIPTLPANQITTLTTAITTAFSEYGISQRDLTFEAYQADSDDRSFEIIMTFVQTSGQK